MLKERLYKSLNITRIFMQNHPTMTGWLELFFPYKSFLSLPAIVITILEIYSRKLTGFLILYALSVDAKLRLRAVLLFTESWLHDQLQQKACSSLF